MSTCKLVIGLIVVIALSSDQSSLSAHGFEFKPCDGYKGPVWPITIESCPDPSKVDACEFSGGWVNVTSEFTPKRDQTDGVHPNLGIEIDGMSRDNSLCESATVKCPLKKGVTQKVKSELSVPRTLDPYPKKLTTAKFYMQDLEHGSLSIWYCIEFPARY